MRHIGLLEDNIQLRNSLEDYLTISGNCEIVFSESSFRDLQRDITGLDFILIDIHLANESGIDIIPQMKKLYPSAQIIMMTGDSAEPSLLLQAIENGANSFIYKPFECESLIKTMDELQKNGSYLEPYLLTSLMALINSKNEISPLLYNKNILSSREKEVIELIKEGLSYKAIAERLYLSTHTVNFHLKKIYLKFDVNSKMELLAKHLSK